MSGAYYNEHDAYAAEWLRNLIAAGHLPDGEVDERDIRDVAPAELIRFTQCHFFAGIGIWPLAFRRAGWPDDRPLWTGSAPCQPFSEAGAGAGFTDERHLWPHWHWLIQHVRPRVVAGEQVASKDGLGWLDLVSADLDGIGYASGATNICAAGFGMDWRGSAESQRLERALRDCPDPMVARHMVAFAEWADQALAIGGFHIRQRLYFVGLADEPGGGLGVERDALEPGPSGHLDGGGDPSGRVADGQGGGGGAGLCDRGPAEQRGHVDSDDRPAVGLVNGERARSQGQRGDGGRGDEPGRLGADPARSTAAAGDAGRLGDLDGDGRHEGHARDDRATESARGEDGHGDARSGRDGGLDDSLGVGRRARRDGDHAGDERVEPRPAIAGGEPGAGGTGQANVEWGNADWLLCRDGFWRPAGPGTFPLVDATPARVGRLRAYGNGLDLETATRFAECVTEICAERGLFRD